jgi:hypothetical protein
MQLSLNMDDTLTFADAGQASAINKADAIPNRTPVRIIYYPFQKKVQPLADNLLLLEPTLRTEVLNCLIFPVAGIGMGPWPIWTHTR